MKKKLLALVILAAMLLNLFPVYAAGSPTFEAETVSGKPGETVTVGIYVKNSPGIAGDTVYIHYDTANLELTNMAAGGQSGMTFVPTHNSQWGTSPVKMMEIGGLFDKTGDWLIGTLTFVIKDGAPAGLLPITLEYDPDDVCDTNFDNVHFEITHGGVEVIADALPVAVTGVSLDKSTLTLTEGQTAALTATVAPADAADKTVVFTSGNNAVATVDNSGKVTAVGKGTAVITVKTNDGGFTAQCTVTVGCGHTSKTTVPAKASDCQNQGWDSYKKCDGCGQLFDLSDAQIAEIPFRPLSGTHTGGTATCTDKAVCSVCGTAYGSLAAHNYKAAEKKAEALKSEGTCAAEAVYYYSCENCGKVELNDAHTFKGEKDPANHAGTTKLENVKAADHANQIDGYTGDTVWQCCGKTESTGSAIPAGAHTPGSTYKSDSTHHWKVCSQSGCGAILELTAHTPDHAGGATEEYAVKCVDCGYVIEAQLAHTHVFKNIVKDTFKASDATCEKKATYYKSCACGEKSKETFENGELAAHTPDHDKATEAYAVKCTVCGKVLEEQLAHTHKFKEVVADEFKASDATCQKKATYYKSCACGEKSEETFETGKLAAHTPDHDEPTEEYAVKCTVCGKTLEEKLAHTHKFQEVVDKKFLASKATCEKKATYYKSCPCGEKSKETFEAGELAAHKPDHDKATEAYAVKCTVCGKILEAQLAHTHKFKEVVADEFKASDATCQKKATYYKSCACGEKSEETFETGKLAAHTPDHDKPTEEYAVKCTVCGKILKEQLAHTHKYQEVVADEFKATDATCKKKATYYKSCACGKLSSKTFEAGELAAHTPDHDEPTEEYAVKCTVCGKVLEAQLDHTHVFQEVVDEKFVAEDATCLKKATYYKSCACGEKSKETFEAGELAAHTPDHDKPTEEYAVKCTVCGKILEEQLAHTHAFKPVVKDEFKATDATCEKKATYFESCACGEKSEETFEFGSLAAHTPDHEEATEEYAVTCTVCGKILEEQLEHTHKFQEVVADEFKATDATCEKQATYYKSCACGEKSSKTFKAGELAAHTPDHDEPTEEYAVKCTVCGKTLEEKLEHTHKFQEVVADEFKANDATCEKKAAYYKSCACGEKSDETFEVGELAAHTPDHEAATDEYPVKCTVCGTILEQQLPHDHKYQEVVDAKFLATEATCQKKATYFKSCTCEAMSEETFEAGELADHTPDHEEATEEYGVTCTVCGTVLQEKLEHVHKFQEVVADEFKVSDATCEKKATYNKSCACGEKSEEIFETGELAAHTPDANNVVCTVCGESLVKPETPVTGDESKLVLVSLLLVVAAMGTVATVSLKKRMYR